MIDFKARIYELYHDKDYNCARTTLICLCEEFGVKLEPQTFNAAIGMNGAGRFRGQCGLVEGALMFIGFCGAERGLKDKEIVKICHKFSKAFHERFKSISCYDLRPGGFQKGDPPHMCENLTVDTTAFTIEFLKQYF